MRVCGMVVMVTNVFVFRPPTEYSARREEESGALSPPHTLPSAHPHSSLFSFVSSLFLLPPSLPSSLPPSPPPSLFSLLPLAK